MLKKQSRRDNFFLQGLSWAIFLFLVDRENKHWYTQLYFEIVTDFSSLESPIGCTGLRRDREGNGCSEKAKLTFSNQMERIHLLSIIE